ncbi:MAG: prolyl oligopeptidase family serine peptidase [archaeon]
MGEIYRTIFKKEIISEFAIPKSKTNKVIIICGGMPGGPSKKEVIELLCKKGYWVFAPRYRGSWESHGKFLKKSPHIDILDVIEGINKGFVDLWSNKKYLIKSLEIFLLGISFGGPAAILASKHPKVKKVLAISPVIDWRVDSKVEPIDKLGKFVKIAFGNGYRFSFSDWNKMKNGKIYNPITELEKADPNKIWILHAKDDDIVLVSPTIKFAKLTGCRLTLFKKGKHSIVKKILYKRRFQRKIFKFLT